MPAYSLKSNLIMNALSNRKSRLKKVIKVLFPEYKYISVKNDLSVVMCKQRGLLWGAKLFAKKDRTSFNLLVSHYIPKKLTLLKYNNKDFLSTVIEDITAVEMRGGDVVSYFYKEIIKIKYPHVFKEVVIPNVVYSYEEPEEPTPIVKIIYKDRIIKKKSFRDHPLYYEYLIIGAITLIVFITLML